MTASSRRRDGVDTAWQRALRLWRVRLRPPQIRNGLGATVGSFAWFSFPPEVSIDLDLARDEGVAGFLETVFAHEIGHHVLAPSTRIDSLKITHQMARGLTAAGLGHDALSGYPALLSNVWCDILINNRIAEIQRRGGRPEMVAMWRTLSREGSAPRLGSYWWSSCEVTSCCGRYPPAGCARRTRPRNPHRTRAIRTGAIRPRPPTPSPGQCPRSWT
ncbi:hypothetical protein AAFP35_00615 [Gordonia sp. CPCC 206044]|uniref:hypothetical protein n=1 Tax=Gordonia sp. CPCC 206044 TaxID=3140793 RepID=UPI003AF3A273